MAKRKPAKKAKPKAKGTASKKKRTKVKAKGKGKAKVKGKAPAKKKPSAARARKKKRAAPPPLKAVRTALVPIILDAPPAGQAEEKPPPQRKRRLRPAQLAEIRELLLKRREELIAEIREEINQSKTGEKQRSADPTDQASDSADGDLALALAQSDSDELAEINAALNRIDGGEFGLCEECGRNIPMERLRALPYATACIDCKRRKELKGTTEGLEDAWEALHNSEEEAANEE